MRYTQHSWPAHNCSQPPALRPCPRTQRGPAARSAAALGTPRSPITISLRPMKNCGSSAAARGGLAAGWGNSTQHQQHIVRSSQEEDLVNWLNSLTYRYKIHSIYWHWNHWIPSSPYFIWATGRVLMGWQGCGLTSDWRRWWSRGRRARAAPAPGHPPRTRPSSSPRLSHRSWAGWDLDKIHGCMAYFISFSFEK